MVLTITNFRGSTTSPANGGKVDMPLAKQFWGGMFGMVTDKFGIHWMINIASQTQQP